MQTFLRKAALAALFAFGATGALANPSLIVDVSTGKVLFAQEATVPWNPASVTKLMTTYVALKQIRAGEIGLETPIPFSPRAAAAAPSKIGGRPGQVMTLDNALHILLVKSANDVAILIAEGVAGTVESFAQLMNEEAARLGMRESRFVNPNGLHAVGQQTSARDMAILARALLRDFPEYREYYGIGAVRLGKRVMKNTNGLIGRYPGADGMKTGFTCPSGFNVVATATRGGRQLIAVVFGASSATERTIKAASLFDKGFGSAGGFFMQSSTLEELPPSGVTTAPNLREEVCMRRSGAAPAEDEDDVVTLAPVASGGDDSGARAFVQQAQGMRLPTASSSSVASRDAQGRRALGPRAEFDPIIVAFGPSANSASAPPAANRLIAVASQPKPGTTAYSDSAKPVTEPTLKVKTGAASPASLKTQARTKPPVANRSAALTPPETAKGKPATVVPSGARPKPVEATAPAKPGKPGAPAAKVVQKPKAKPQADKEQSATQ